jgi:hypothetical protein
LATDLTQRLKQQQEIPEIEVKGFSGLSLKIDGVNQPAGVWQFLDNFDLYIPGSIRKVLPPTIVSTPGVNILEFVDWYTQPNSSSGPTIRTIGLSLTGTTVSVWDFATSAVIFTITNVFFQGFPKLLQAPVFFVPYNIRNWQPNTIYALYDGIIKYDPQTGLLNVWYVSGPGTTGLNQPSWIAANSPITFDGVTWTVDGVPTSNRYLESALVIVLPGYPPFYAVEWQYNPNDDTETPKYYIFPPNGLNPNLGIPPEVPTEVEPTLIAPNLNGYAPAAGRAYSYTFYNPNLLHETSPAPIAGPTKITEIDNDYMQATVPGSIIQPIPVGGKSQGTFSSYQQLYAAIPLADVQAINPQYSCIYLYTTKDGGATLYRVTQVYDNNDNVISNSDGSVPIAALIALQGTNNWKDYFPLPTPQAMQASVRLYEGGGPVNLAPDAQNLGADAWNIGKGQSMYIQPGDSPLGQAAIEITGTGSALNKNITASNLIRVATHTQYYFQGYIDAVNLISGVMSWQIQDSSGNVLISYTQTAGVAGYLGGAFTTGSDALIRLRAYSDNADITTGEVVQWSEPILEIGSGLSATSSNYPTTDDALIIPSPAPLSQGPFPALLTACIFQGSLMGVDFNDRLRTWFSLQGDVLSLPTDNFLDQISSRSEPILEILEMFDRVLVGKQRQLWQITGSPPTLAFNDAPIDPQHGTQSSRGSIGIGSSVITLLSVGIALVGLGLYVPQPDEVTIGFRPEEIIGDPVKPLTDLIDQSTLRQYGITSPWQPCPAIDNTQNIYLFAYGTFNGDPVIEHTPTPNMLVNTLLHKGPTPWSTFSGFPINEESFNKLPFTTVKEVQFFNTTESVELLGVLASCKNGNVYQMWGGTQDGTLTATAVTWPLPDLSQLPFELRDTMKVFRELWVEGEDIPNFYFSWSTDGLPAYVNGVFNVSKQWSPLRQLQNRNQMGADGRQIEIMFVHTAATTNTPLLSYMKINYDIKAQAAGGPGIGANY